MGIVLSVVIGILFAFCGIAYRIGGIGKVYPIQCLAFLAVPGAIVFAVLAGPQWHTMSWQLLLLGGAVGITQYLGVRLLRYALTLGPLSPAWCAQSLNFVPVILYSAIMLKEHLSLCQYGALLATVGAILAAACDADPGNGKKAESCREKLHYGLVLVALLISISIFSVFLKYCSVARAAGTEQTLVARSGNVLMTLIYISIFFSAALDLTLSHSWQWNRYAFIGGALLSLCAIVAYVLTLMIVARVPAMILFVLSNATSIFGASLMSVLFFKEKRSKAWYWTIAFSLLAIVLNR